MPDASILRRKLKAWYRKHARALPWREGRDPYRVWLSEIMLQQTRVEAVIPYYNRFLATFPDIHALAFASEDAVLHCWEGLGYYSRARNLHAAAQMISASTGGRFPDTVEGLLALPGIGAYTAGAIASICFGRAAPLVDGNVKRVLARLFEIEDCVDTPAATKRLWQIAGDLVPTRAPGMWNQALMELGARICIPKHPRCTSCPLSAQCEAYAHDMTAELPVRASKKPVPHKEVVCAIIERKGKLLLGRRQAGMLRGLWEFPGGTVQELETHADALCRIIRKETTLQLQVGNALCAIDHAYTHFTLTLHAYRCTAKGTARANHHDALVWVSPDALAAYALPRVDRIAADTWLAVDN